MLNPSETIAHNYSVAVFCITAIGICFLMLIISYFLGGKTYKKYKNIPFESGIDSVGSARLRLSIKFYIIAMLFVIFDVESLYLFAWSISVREIGWVGFIEVIIFIMVLLISLFYLVRAGLLDWVSTFSRRKSSQVRHNIK